jgi:hypothetical protein
VGVGNLVPDTAPQQSTRGFVAPAAMPVKRTPDITDIIGEKGEKEKGEKDKWANGGMDESAKSPPLAGAGGGDEKMRRLDDAMINNKEEQSSSNHLIPTSSNHLTVLHSYDLTVFNDHWRAMFEQVFASVPTVFFTLKDSLPEIENNIIKFVVKNEIQKDHFESKTREALEYLRTHFNEEIEDIVVETNEKLETKKIIYDVKDKLQNFKEQNEEFEDFIQILELKIKD